MAKLSGFVRFCPAPPRKSAAMPSRWTAARRGGTHPIQSLRCRQSGEETTMDALRFGGSLWCNVDIALRNLDQVYGRGIGDLEVSVTEWYILRALYRQDGQHASELARAIGRAATTFTPLLDGLEAKALVERRA